MTVRVRLDVLRDIAAAVVERLLNLIAPPLEVQWRSASFAVHMSEPGAEDGTLPLCVVTERLVLYGYLPWLQRRIERSWPDANAVAFVLDAYTGLWTKYGAKPTRTRQYNVALASMAAGGYKHYEPGSLNPVSCFGMSATFWPLIDVTEPHET